MTELPVTTTEDYTLFNILQDPSISLWERQMSAILESHGLMNFIIHPDYIVDRQAQRVYTSLLEELLRLRSDNSVWMTLPHEVDRWWRKRTEMRLVRIGPNWAIEGPGSNRATVAHARSDGGRLVYEMTKRVGTRSLPT